METYVLFVSLILFASVAASPPRVTKQYRTDYVYDMKTDAFYKLHTESKRGWQVKKICELEGGNLFVPSTTEDVAVLREMRFANLGEYVWIGYNGTLDISNEYDLTSTANTPSEWLQKSCNVQSLWGDITEKPCTEQLPFMCKVEAKKAPYDKRCHSYGINYQYVSSVGSCYKIPRIAYTWNEAYTECRAEGAHLLVLNSEAERLAVKKIIDGTPRLHGSQHSMYYHIGIIEEKTKNNYPRVFKTIFDESLSEAGFSDWALGEPNLENERCGAVFEQDSMLSDIGCSAKSGFVCEKEEPLTENTSSRPDTTSYAPPSRLKKFTYIETKVVKDYE